MAAGNFTASDMNTAQVKLESMFADPNTARTEMQKGEAATARALLSRQTATASPILKDGKCVAVDAWFYRPGAADSLSQVAGLSGCALPTSTEGETAKETYETDVIASASVKLKDNRCANLIDFQEEFMWAQKHVMALLRYGLNTTVVIPGLSAATQANLDTMIDGSWDDTSQTPRIVVPTADFTYANLNEFRIVAQNNGFGDFFFVSGRLFNDDHWMAMLNRLNETQRNQALAWANREIYFDERDLDVTMTRKTAFAVDANSYIFWNSFRSSPAVTLTDPENNRFQWAMPDPFLTYRDGGRERPVVYEFEMTKTCGARDAHGFPQYTYNMWGRLVGGFSFAPVGPNDETGVLQFAES